MGMALDRWLDQDDNADKWTSGKFKAFQRRILLVSWFAQACAMVFQKRRALYRCGSPVCPV